MPLADPARPRKNLAAAPTMHISVTCAVASVHVTRRCDRDVDSMPIAPRPSTPVAGDLDMLRDISALWASQSPLKTGPRFVSGRPPLGDFIVEVCLAILDALAPWKRRKPRSRPGRPDPWKPFRAAWGNLCPSPSITRSLQRTVLCGIAHAPSHHLLEHASGLPMQRPTFWMSYSRSTTPWSISPCQAKGAPRQQHSSPSACPWRQLFFVGIGFQAHHAPNLARFGRSAGLFT